jgi:hypothetical protein
VLLLTAIGGLSYTEVAFALGIPAGTVDAHSAAPAGIIAALSGTGTMTGAFEAHSWRN